MTKSILPRNERNDLALLHEKMISLLQDTRSYQQFLQSPSDYLSQSGDLPVIYSKLLTSINLGGLSTFRRIVRGTRELRLKQVFNKLYEKIGSESAWQSLIDEFLDSVVIKNGRNDLDLTLFAEFMRATRSSALGDLAILERSIYAVSNNYVDFVDLDGKFNPENDIEISPWVEVITTSFSAKTLLSTESDNCVNESSGAHRTLIFRSQVDNDIRLRPITLELGNLLSESRYLPSRAFIKNERLSAEIKRLWTDGCFCAGGSHDHDR